MMRSLRFLIPAATIAAGVIGVLACNTASDDAAANTRSAQARQVVDGNPTCSDLGLGTMATKIEPPVDGTYPLTGGSVTISNANGTTFDFSSTIGIDAVIVKGGNSANVYNFSPEATSGTGLHAPTNPSGGFAGLSHIDFCYDEDQDSGNGSTSSSGGSTSSSGGSTSSSGGSTSSSGGSTSSSGGSTSSSGQTW